MNSVELPLSVWNYLESQRFRILEDALAGAPLPQEQQQRPFEVHETLEAPGMQDPPPGWEGQEVLVDNFSTSDSVVATVSPMGTIETDTTPTSPNIIHLAVNGLDYPVFNEDNRDGADVDVGDNDDDTNIENDDEEKAQNVPTPAQMPNREGENHSHHVRLRRSQGVPFQRAENFTDSVIRSLSE